MPDFPALIWQFPKSILWIRVQAHGHTPRGSPFRISAAARIAHGVYKQLDLATLFVGPILLLLAQPLEGYQLLVRSRFIASSPQTLGKVIANAGVIWVGLERLLILGDGLRVPLLTKIESSEQSVSVGVIRVDLEAPFQKRFDLCGQFRLRLFLIGFPQAHCVVVARGSVVRISFQETLETRTRLGSDWRRKIVVYRSCKRNRQCVGGIQVRSTEESAGRLVKTV